MGTQGAARRALVDIYNARKAKGESVRVFPTVQLDGAGHLAVHPSGRDRNRTTVHVCDAPRPTVERDGLITNGG